MPNRSPKIASKKSVAARDVGGAQRARAVDGAEAIVVLALVASESTAYAIASSLKLLLGRLVARVAVGVPLERELAIGTP